MMSQYMCSLERGYALEGTSTYVKIFTRATKKKPYICGSWVLYSKFAAQRADPRR